LILGWNIWITHTDQQGLGVLGHGHGAKDAGHYDDGAQEDAEHGGQILAVIQAHYSLLFREALQQPGAIPDEQAAT